MPEIEVVNQRGGRQMGDNLGGADRWDIALERLLPQFGHRNWIVIADSAYPLQSNPGVQTFATSADHLGVVATILSQIRDRAHIRPVIYVDAELGAISEQSAPGVTSFREKLAELVGGPDVHRVPHEKIIQRLDQTAKLFAVAIFKSTLAIPYTSVFIELDCGYWSADAEKQMRLSFQRSQEPQLEQSSAHEKGSA